MHIMITGANGMLGEECVRNLSEKHEVFACDLHDTLQYDGSVDYAPLNVMDSQEVYRIIKEVQPELVVNCAAYTNVDGSERDHKTAWAINAGGVRYLIDEMSKIGARLIQISTDYVFDGTEGPYTEDAEVNPINYYGQSKLDAEKIIRDSEIPATIIRTNVLYGNTTLQKASFVRWVVEKLSHFESISVVNDQFGNPTWSFGLAEAIARVIETDTTGLYHYGGKDYINRFEFALKIAQVHDLDPMLIRKTSTRALNQIAPRPYKAGLVCKKIVNELNVKLYSINESLNHMKGAA